MSKNANSEAPAHKTVEWAEFIQSYPPGSTATLSDATLGERQLSGGPAQIKLLAPDLELNCDSDSCAGLRFFGSDSVPILGTYGRSFSTNAFLEYGCRNCGNSWKVFAFVVTIASGSTDATVVKIGEWPTFGPPIPARVQRLIQNDRELYLKGHSSENQGLGVGAFAYYRRVVENQKSRLIEQIAKVAQVVGAASDVIATLQAAESEVQFTKAVTMIKDAVPQSLLISGHNPITLLHKALSEGVHAQTDEECLEYAADIRLVLTELAERLGSALKDHAELNAAVNRLMKPKTPKR